MAVGLIAPVWEQAGLTELWLTAANEGGHKTNADPQRQFHQLPNGTCQAFDLRTRAITDVIVKKRLTELTKNILGFEYDVIFHEDEFKDGKQIMFEHCHIQWDPWRPGTR